MANKTVFKSQPGRYDVQPANATNEAGGVAYAKTPEAVLAQYVMTGTFNNTYYVSGEGQIANMLGVLRNVDPEYVAKLAIYARQNGFMKDMPAFLTAWLSQHGPKYLPIVFNRVIDNGKMLRNFVQIMRSGVVGRRSLGTRPKKLVQNFISGLSWTGLMSAMIGNNPSLADIIKMVHPNPAADEANTTRSEIYKYIIGKDYDIQWLPSIFRALIEFRKTQDLNILKSHLIPFELLTSGDINEETWKYIADSASWTQTRMNLNTFSRHNVFSDSEMTAKIASRLRNPNLIKKSRVFPYQIMTAYLNASTSIPDAVTLALQDALDIALLNVPVFDGSMVVAIDTSGSMGSSITGERKGSTSKVTCVGVAGLIASALIKKSKNSEIMAFDTSIRKFNYDPSDSVMTNSKKFGSYHGGGTNCSLPLEDIKRRNLSPDVIVYVSDYESWAVGLGQHRYYGTGMATKWSEIKEYSPKTKLICIDLTPNTTQQLPDLEDVLFVGGFSDQVFNMISLFMDGRLSGSYWVDYIKEVQL